MVGVAVVSWSVSSILTVLTEVRGVMAASPLIVIGTFAAIGFFGVLTLGGSRAAAVALLGLGLAWPVVNARVEGPTLLMLSWNHGISAADLLGAAAVGVAAWRLVPRPVAAPPR